MLHTNNIDHHRTADYVAFAQSLAGSTGRAASLRDTLTAKAVLLVGGDPTNQSPATAWNLRTNVRLNGAKLYIANTAEIKLRRQARAFLQVAEYGYGALAAYLAGDDSSANAAAADSAALAGFRDAVRSEESLLILIGNELRGAELKRLIDFGLTLPGAKFALLADYANSRGAADMGLLPDMLPGYTPIGPIDTGDPGSRIALEYRSPTTPGLDLLQIFDAAAAGNLSALYVVGANPVARYDVDPASLKDTFVVVQEMFLTETAALADVVLPAANLYEKSGSVTNSYGDLQQVKKAADLAGVRSRLRDDRPHRRQDGRGAAQARSVWRRSARRHGPVARRGVGRGRSPRRLADRKQPGAAPQPLRSIGDSRRDSAPGAGL